MTVNRNWNRARVHNWVALASVIAIVLTAALCVVIVT